MNGNFFVLAEGVLGLHTNAEHFKWSYGIDAPPAKQKAYDQCAVRLELHVGDVAGIAPENDLGRYHYFYGAPGTDILYYQRPFLLNTRLQLKAERLLSARPCVSVNKTYYRFITHRFMNLHSVGYILTDVASLLLLRRGYAPLHCSAFRRGGATVVIFAPPNIGKTLSTMMACLEYGAEFLAEDFAITDGKTVFSVPWTSTFRYYSRVDSGYWPRLANALTQKIPVLELLPLVKVKPVNAYIDEKQMLARSDVTHVVILERGETSIQRVSPDEAFRKIANLNRYEFNYRKAPLIVAYEFFNPSLNIEAACQTERNILKGLINNARELLVVRTPDATEYASLILDALG